MLVMAAIVYLIWYVAPVHGNTSIFVYLGICSLIGSLSVMSVKARLAPCTATKLNLHLHGICSLIGSLSVMSVKARARRAQHSQLKCAFSLPNVCQASPWSGARFIPDKFVLASFSATGVQE